MMTERDSVEVTGDPGTRPAAGRVAFFVVGGTLLLTLFHFAVQHGEHVESMRRRGLDTFTVGMAIRETVHRPGGDGLFPAWDPQPGVLFFDRDQVNPFYTIGPRLNRALNDPDEAVLVTANLVDNRVGYRLAEYPDPSKYFYLPYAVRNEREGLALLDAYREAAQSGQGWTGDLPASEGQGTGGTDTFYRLHRGIQETLKEQHPELPEEHTLREQFPVLIEWPGESSGAWVVFFDRDPVWMDYPGEFPLTERFIGALVDVERNLVRGQE